MEKKRLVTYLFNFSLLIRVNSSRQSTNKNSEPNTLFFNDTQLMRHFNGIPLSEGGSSSNKIRRRIKAESTERKKNHKLFFSLATAHRLFNADRRKSTIFFWSEHSIERDALCEIVLTSNHLFAALHFHPFQLIEWNNASSQIKYVKFDASLWSLYGL